MAICPCLKKLKGGELEEEEEERDEAAAERAGVFDDEHLLPTEDLASRLGTCLEAGLGEDEAGKRLARDGPNRLTPPTKLPEWLKFLKTLFYGFAGLLWSAGILCFVAYAVQAASLADDDEEARFSRVRNCNKNFSRL